MSRGTNVLAEYTRRRGNFETVTRLILRKIEDSRRSDEVGQIKYDAYMFHFKIVDSLMFVAMTHEAARTRLPMVFLDEVAESFQARYGGAEEAIAYQYDDDFGPLLRQKVHHFATSPEVDVIGKVKSKIDDARDELVIAIEQLLERGEKIELLVDKTEQMTEHAHKFERTATRLKDSLWWKRLKLYFFVFFILGVLGIFVALMACGLTFEKC